VFSFEGALKIASYIDQHEKRGILYRFKEFFTKHDQKIRRSLARKLIFAELTDSGEIQVYQGVAMIHKQSLRRILKTNGAKLNQTFNNLKIQESSSLKVDDEELAKVFRNTKTEVRPLKIGVDFYEDDKGTLFMENTVETTIRCLHSDRHDSITLPAGTYEFGSQQEYDPFTARMNAVRD